MIRISGEAAITLAAQIFRAANGVSVTKMAGYTCAYGRIYEDEMFLDDVILTVFRAPHSYTGEDVVEITCHGGIYLCQRILSLLYRVGAVPAGAGEFTKRAYLNGKLSLSQAEAVMDVIAADCAFSLRQANLVRSGWLSREMRARSAALTDLLSAFAYWMDDAEAFPPELESERLCAQLSSIRSDLQEMANRYRDGKIFRDGIRTVLLGLPNAGKSSVMNWLTGMQRSIVTDIAGTTRDIITEQVRFGDYTLVLADTAGIRESDNPIEAMGVSAALSEVEQSDLILYVVDASVGLTEADNAMLRRFQSQKMILLWNKTDVCSSTPAPILELPVVPCAARKHLGREALQAAMETLFPVPCSPANPTVLNERQFLLLREALDSIDHALADLLSQAELDMVYQSLEFAANALRALDGERVSEDVVEGVFAKFCVGK